MSYRNNINLGDDLEKPIYRIISIERLLECLAEKKLVLVSPKKWDDPFENWLLSSEFKIPGIDETADMGPSIRDKICAQCWSQHEETDAMWRIYSSDKRGVKIKTTPKKLLEALMASVKENPELFCFIGKVKYGNEHEIRKYFNDIKLLDTNGSGIAESLLCKRSEFSHEKEVRVLYTDAEKDLYVFPIEPNNLFEEVIFDPRIDKNLFSAYKSEIKKIGFNGKIEKSILYQSPEKLCKNL